MRLDKRAKTLANILIDYSLKIQENDVLMIQGEDSFSAFGDHIASLALQKGANIIFEYFDLQQKKDLIERCDEEELKEESKRLCDIAESITARTYIDASMDPLYLENVDPKKVAKYTEIVKKPFLDRVVGDGNKWKGIKWNVCGYPSHGDAKIAKMSFEKYCDFVFSATNIDWESTKENMQKIKKIFDDAEKVRIYVKGQTDLTFSLKGRGGAICSGDNNMPDGEAFYCPEEDSANGIVFFPYNSINQGKEIGGIRLRYENGEIKESYAQKNNEALKAKLELEGMKRIGEFGIGCNYGIKKYTKNLLFDEKIGGTIHIALGKSYNVPLDCGGGLNEAMDHWDLVCDLRKVNGQPGGEIYVNGKLVQKNGVWKF